MKRAVLFITALIASGLCSCASDSGKVKPVEIAEDLTVKAQMEIDGTEYTATVKRGGADMWEWQLTEPATVSGMVISCSGGTARLEYKGLTYQTDRSAIPESSAVTLTNAVLDRLISQKGVTYLKNDKGDITATGQVSGQDFSAKIKGGKIKSVEIADDVKVNLT